MAHDTQNDDDDLSGLDRGDNLADDKSGDTKSDDTKTGGGADDEGETVRDDKGRFTKKTEGDKDAKGGEGDAGDDAEDDGGEDDDADDDADDSIDGDDGKNNFPIRLNKAKLQRDEARKQLEAERAAKEALEARLREIEEQLKGKDAPKQKTQAELLNEELDALYVQVEEARLDGKADDAAKLQRQIDAKNRELVKLEATADIDTRVSKLTAEQAEAQRYDAMLDFLETKIDVLNPKHEDYDKRYADAIEFTAASYEKNGMSPSRALHTAASLILRNDPFAQGGAPEPKDEGKKDPPAKKGIDVKKAVETTKRQPPDASSRGLNRDDTKIRVADLDDEAFDALPESKKRELRGDLA